MNLNLVAGICLMGFLVAAGGDSLPPLKDGRVPQNLDELWRGYDPQAEPLETQVVRQWVEDDVVLRYVVFTVGTFKGRKSRLAAFYGFPARANGRLPALLHLHGGGQRAFLHEVKHAAWNGYAGLSINWGGKPMEGAAEGDPNTDWGAVDPTQTGHNSHYASLEPDEKTLDAVASPRNNNWFLLVLAARRALTFLEHQPEVDPNRIGVHGHSMGGKLTTDLAGVDERVRAAVPSCGGAGSATAVLARRPGSGLRPARSPLHLRTIDDRAYIPRIRCPILYLGPTNDFNAPIDCVLANWAAVGSPQVRFAVSPHLNHRHVQGCEVCRLLWFEQWLKGRVAFPETPRLEVELRTQDGVPRAVVWPDRPGDVVKVEVHYSSDRHVLTRFWRSANVERRGERWTARCPLLTTRAPLFVLANATYRHGLDLAKPRTRQPHRKFFTITSRLATIEPQALARAGVKATEKPSLLIEEFTGEWRDWFSLAWANPVHWSATTRKLKDPQWRGPAGARLALDVLSPQDNLLVFEFAFNTWRAFPHTPTGTFVAVKKIEGSRDWHTLTVSLDELVPSRDVRPVDWRPRDWATVCELTLRCRATVLRDGAQHLVEWRWRGPRRFRNLRWTPADSRVDNSGGPS